MAQEKTKLTLRDAVRIKKLRVDFSYSQRDLAKEFGGSPGAVAHWKSGEWQISGPALKLLEIFEAKARKSLLRAFS